MAQLGVDMTHEQSSEMEPVYECQLPNKVSLTVSDSMNVEDTPQQGELVLTHKADRHTRSQTGGSDCVDMGERQRKQYQQQQQWRQQ